SIIFAILTDKSLFKEFLGQEKNTNGPIFL
ncbi:unnamed protein product, partial [marine sediment metagenome]